MCKYEYIYTYILFLFSYTCVYIYTQVYLFMYKNWLCIIITSILKRKFLWRCVFLLLCSDKMIQL